MILVRDAITTEMSDEIHIYLPPSALNDSDEKEFAATGSFEDAIASKPRGRMLFDDITFKSDFIRTFDAVKSMIDIRPAHTVLELGAAHGWASVMVKDDCPDARVVASDVVPACIKHCKRYEDVLGRAVDEKWAFSVRDIPFADAQFDRIFTFASFHHFGDHGNYAQPMAEMSRILKPGGKLVLLYEPTTPSVLYPLAHKRVNLRRAHEGLDEDVLVLDTLKAIATKLGLAMKVTPFPFYHYRNSVGTTVYYYLLAKLHLSRFMVCTKNIVFQKER